MLPRTVRALVKPAPGPGLELREIPVPTPGPNDVLNPPRQRVRCHPLRLAPPK